MKRATGYANGCGWCKLETAKDGRMHMLLECETWDSARAESGLDAKIQELGTRKMAPEKMISVLLQGEQVGIVTKFLRGVCSIRGRIKKDEVEAH